MKKLVKNAFFSEDPTPGSEGGTRSFRLGATSWILESDLADNARYLSTLVDDMEMVLFEVSGGTSNFPNQTERDKLRQVSEETGFSYTVHLPLDLRSDLGPNHPSIAMARRVIELCSELKPRAYVAHIDEQGRAQEEQSWLEQAVFAVSTLARFLPDPSMLAVENLEGSAPDTVDKVLHELPDLAVSRCVDVGHLWLDGHDPLPWLQSAMPRLSVVHLHGLAFDPVRGRICDHTSLAHMEIAKVQSVLTFLKQHEFDGILTIEVFSEKDFTESYDLIDRLRLLEP